MLRALAASGVVEHVCRFAVTRLAGQRAGGGMAGLSAEKKSKHGRFIMELMSDAIQLAYQTIRDNGVGRAAADAKALLSSPCLQVGPGPPSCTT